MTTNTKLGKKMQPRYMHTMTTVMGSTAAVLDENTRFSRLLWA